MFLVTVLGIGILIVMEFWSSCGIRIEGCRIKKGSRIRKSMEGIKREDETRKG